MITTRPPLGQLLVLAMCAAIGACASPGGTDSPASATTSPRASTVPASADGEPSQPATVGDVPADVLADLIADAANRAGVDASEVTAISAEAVTWADGSLGCPSPGQAYTQALVPGYRVILDVGGDEVSYHASDRLDFSPCDDPQPPADTGTVDR
jgi:hypothetical protein